MDSQKERERAERQISRYRQTWGDRYLDLACHAAFPLAFTPELLYLLRENFLPDCPWIAIADFLLSPLCLTVGDELYEMEAIVRDSLLRRLSLDRRFGATRLKELADFMAAYIAMKLPESPKIAKNLGNEPQWIALAYIRPEDARPLRESLTQLLKEKGRKVHPRLATFLDAEEDLLISAGLEPLVISPLKMGLLLDPFVEVAIMEFSTVFVNRRGEITETKPCTAYYYEEPLKNGIDPLTMIAIPAGEFQMGSPGEKDDRNNEKPPHPVKVNAFYLSQTPITQAQWEFIAKQPQIARELKPNPSYVKEKNNPVENVNWYDAIEFCARLSRHTGREYRLPSEAEWEYACRARTTTPFHFGETITGDLANYNANNTYAEESKGVYRSKTTPVKQFPPNAFGLHDMHGNVWEWCLDPWHSSYKDAPKDSRVWDEKNENENDNRYHSILNNINILLENKRSRVLRGGSWYNSPGYCRSANRGRNDPDDDYNAFGFRVACVGA